MNPYILTPDLNGEGLHIGIVRARFNEEIGQAELEACLKELAELGVDERDVMVATVPGALELGVALSHMAETFEFDALIALGAVIRGETYHFEVVSNEMATAITRIPRNRHPHRQRRADRRHRRAGAGARRGRDCAQVAVEMANLVAALEPEEEDEDDEDEDFDDEEDDDQR